MRSCIKNARSGNFRMVSTGPRRASGGTMALIREPSASRASTMGDASSTRRPTPWTMRSMIRRYWCGDGEHDLATLDLALALDPDLVVGVAHDLGDGAVGKQAVERSVSERVLQHLLHEALTLDRGDADVLALEDLVDGGADLLPQLVGRQVGRRGGDLGQHLGLHLRLGLLPLLVERRPIGRPPHGVPLGPGRPDRAGSPPRRRAPGIPGPAVVTAPRRVAGGTAAPSASANFSDRFMAIRPSRAQAPCWCDPSSSAKNRGTRRSPPCSPPYPARAPRHRRGAGACRPRASCRCRNWPPR